MMIKNINKQLRGRMLNPHYRNLSQVQVNESVLSKSQ